MALREYRMGKGKWVFVDWACIEPGYGTGWGGTISNGYCMPEGIRLQVHRPKIHPEPAILPDRPWESLGLGWATFLEDGGRLRCWYEAFIPNDHPKWKVAVRLSYAESDDGVTWRKPNLMQREFKGSTANNMIMVSGTYPNMAGGVFIDPSAPAEERYKMVAPGGRHGVLGAVSPDGISWKSLAEPILPKNNSDTDNTCAYLPEIGRYVLYTRQQDGSRQRRGINRAESADFAHFPPSTPVMESNPLDPPDWDYYSNAFCRWPGAQDAFLMCVGAFRHTTDTVEAHLAVSRDTWSWHRPLGPQAWVRLHDDPVEPYAQVYACRGILPAKSGEWFYHLTAWRIGHNEVDSSPEAARPRILRASLREDGFMSLCAEGHGEFWTIPFKMESDRLRLNARTLFSGSLKCEVVEASVVGGTGHAVTLGEAAPGFTLADCDPVTGDHVDAAVTWKGSADLSQFKGKEIRLHFQMFKANLYAIKL